jgi:hypothetical protein
MTDYTFRCASISEEGYFHSIEVPAQGHIQCTCMGQSWCSHIEATLVAGERHMVPPEDRIIADKAQIAAKGRIGPTAEWKSNWRIHRRWRGLPARQSAAQKLMHLGNPVVSIEGRPTLRRKSLEIAELYEWYVNPRPSKGVLIHVVEDKESTTQAAEHARQLGLMIATHEEWATIAPIGRSLHSHIEGLLKESIQT